MSTQDDSTYIRRQPYEQRLEDVVADLGSDSDIGLTSHQARERQKHYGFNTLQAASRVPAWRRFLAQLRDPQVYLLLAATAVAISLWILEGRHGIPYEGLIIFAIVLLNAVLGFIQEDRAEKALLSLQKMVPAQTTVIRDGQQQRLMARDLVPGDVILLVEGDSIPADGRLLSTQSLITTESSLTGESLPVSKSIAPVSTEAVLGDRSNMVFAGTTAIAGNGRAIVTAIGMETEFGRVAELLGKAEEQVTPLQQQLKHLSKQLGVAVVVIALCIVIALLAIYGVQSTTVVMNILLFGIALAVAATPEGLAAVITLVLAIGVQRMARRGAIVKKLPAVETLGSTTVIASDKTGTMTRNEMTVRAIMTASGETAVEGNGYSPEGRLKTTQDQELPERQRDEVHQLLVGAALVNNAQLKESGDGWAIQGDPTEAALLTAARKGLLLPSDICNRYPRIGEIVFSSERKMMSTIHEDNRSSGEYVVFTKGAPDILIKFCTHEFVAGLIRPLTSQRRQEILRDNERLTTRALRTLGVATRSMTSTKPINPIARDEHEIERDLTFLGLVGMMDPPRPEARLAVEQARRAGVRTILITGDHPSTAVAVARELDITADDHVLSGTELDQMSDADLAKAVASTVVYARVKPEHKFRIVRALQKNGQIVAMTGDGVNDAPALKAAHIGIAMGITGTDVSKEAADLILTDDNFSTIVAAVEEGRIVYDNIRKFLRYLLATNLGEVLTVFLSALILSLRGRHGIHALVLPLSAAQILWINLVTDGAPALALGVDSPASDIMDRAPRNPNEGIINHRMMINLVIVAVVMAVGTLSMFFLMPDNTPIEYRRTLAFTTLILFQLFNSLSARSDSESTFIGLFQNHWLWGAILLSIAMQTALLNVPFLERAFGVVPLTGDDWFLVISVASSVLWIGEIVKYIARRTLRSPLDVRN